MKRQLRKVAALTFAAAMTMASTMTASAVGGAAQGTYDDLFTSSIPDVVMNTPYAEPVNGVATNGFRHKISTIVYNENENDIAMPGEMHIAANVMSAEEYFSTEGGSWCKEQFDEHTPAGYVWRFVVGDYSSFDMQQNYRDCSWWYIYDVTNASNWVDINDYTSSEFFYAGSLFSDKKFTVNIDGVDYSECKTMQSSECDDIGRYTLSFAVLLPQNFNGNLNINILGGRQEGEETVMDENSCLTFSLVQGIPAQSPMLPTQNIPTWKQDAYGWWIENPDGTYLTNQWYQSPDSGLWYYMGADGYMLSNTTTPDNYFVNADGVWMP